MSRELPEPHWAPGYQGGLPSGAYSADQMRAFAEEAVRLERERLAFDVALGEVAMRFVDRAGDVADCDPAERICAEFHAAASEVCEKYFRLRNPEIAADAERYRLIVADTLGANDFTTFQPSGYNGGDHVWIEFGFKHQQWAKVTKADIDAAVDAAIRARSQEGQG